MIAIIPLDDNLAHSVSPDVTTLIYAVIILRIFMQLLEIGCCERSMIIFENYEISEFPKLLSLIVQI